MEFEEKAVNTEKYMRGFAHAKDYRSSWEKDAKEAYAFYASRQWDSEDLNKLKEELRPALTFNKIKKFVHSISGSEMTNRYEPKLMPRSLVGSGNAEALTEVIKYIRDRCNGEQADSTAFRDAIICGVGCVEYYQDYETEKEGITRYRRVPIMEMYWDPHSKDTNLLDAKEIFREKWVDEKDFQVMWPDRYEALISNFGMESTTQFSPDKEQPRFDPYGKADELGDYDAQHRRIKVTEHQWYDVVSKIQVEGYQIDPMSGEAVQILDEVLEEDEESTAEEKYTDLNALAEQQGIVLNRVNLPARRYKRAFYVGNELIQSSDCPVNDFTYKFMTGLEDQRDDGTVYWQGIVHDLVDPQRYANKWFSQITHIVSTNPKGAVLAKAGTFDNPQQAKTEWAKPNPMIITNGDPNKNINVIEGKYPTQLEHLFYHANDAIHDIIGVNTNYFVPGVENLNRTAGTAVQSIQKQSLVILSIWFDNLRLFRREQGRILLKFIHEYMAEGTIVRISADGNTQPQPFQREWIDDIEYEVVVEESPTSPSKRHELWNSLMQTQSLEILMNFGLLDGHLVAELIPDITEQQRFRMKQNWDRMMQMQAQQAQAIPPEQAGGV